MKVINDVPTECYGILENVVTENSIDEAVEQLKNVGYAVVDAGYSATELNNISIVFNHTRQQYIEKYGELYLKNRNEFHTIRSLLTQEKSGVFASLLLNEHLINVLKKIIPGKFILNQQNGIINPPNQNYNQGAWHRDLPYQHFVSSKPIAVNALFCIDDFTLENGATFILPASHKNEALPSLNYIKNNAVQIAAKSGSFILLDAMLFHSGGPNKSNAERRAVNHLYNIPMQLKNKDLTAEQKEILGFNYLEAQSVDEYILNRKSKVPQ